MYKAAVFGYNQCIGKKEVYKYGNVFEKYLRGGNCRAKTILCYRSLYSGKKLYGRYQRKN